MKRCPECGRDYDNTMMFCLDDGTELLYGPASMDEPATAILHSTAAPGEAPTRAQIHMTDQTAVLPTGTGDVSKSKGFDKRLLVAPLALAVIVLGGFFGYRYITPAKQIESIAVMPFVNESKNDDVEYLTDGMTETMVTPDGNDLLFSRWLGETWEGPPVGMCTGLTSESSTSSGLKASLGIARLAA